MFGHSDIQQGANGGMQGQPVDPAAASNQMGTNPPQQPSTDQSAPNFSLNDIPAAPNPLAQFQQPQPQQNPFMAPPAPASPTPPAPQQPSTAPASSPAVGGDLLDIKQKALQELSPLVDQLEQSPEEKFKTTMMMIQASDDQALLPAAYDAAQAITDEKARAQALLDVVNEINYFTQK